MAPVFCSNCGASVEGRFCPKCGTQTGTADSTPPASGAPLHAQPASGASLSDNVAGTLCYILGIISGAVFLIIAPYNKSKFVRFHAFQAIFFQVAIILFLMAQTIMSLLFPLAISPIFDFLGLIIRMVGLALWILLMVKAYNNERFKLPIIGDLAEKQA